MNIFHIVLFDEWAKVTAEVPYRPPSLETEGFIHFSYAHQVADTADRYYQDVDGLQVLEVDAAALASPLRIEPSPATGEDFPHLYGPLPITAVVAIHPLPRTDAGTYVF